jgi:hypothetical protein
MPANVMAISFQKNSAGRCFLALESNGKTILCRGKEKVLSAYQEKIPARNAIYAHAQDFSARDELLLAILKAFIPQ